eukprot:4496377-Alexandrium_andersonii.AAC.1
MPQHPNISLSAASLRVRRPVKRAVVLHCLSQRLLRSGKCTAALRRVWSGLQRFLARPHPALFGGAPTPRTTPE